MKSKTAKPRKCRGHIEVIPENAAYEEYGASFGDETPSDDTVQEDQEALSNRKRKRTKGSDTSSKDKEKVSELTSEHVDEQTQDVPTEDVPYTKKTRKKTSESWEYLEEFEKDGIKWARCKLCQAVLKRGPTCSTSSLNRHVNKCKATHGIGLKKQAQLQFQAGDSSSEVTLANFRYDHADMRKTVSHYILVKFAEIAKHLQLKNKKLILDVPTRWNSTFKMLQCAVEFKQVFGRFPSSDKGFEEYVPDAEDWEQVEGVCSILETFNVVTNIVSGTHYPTSNLFLAEIRKVKQILDKNCFDHNFKIREMVGEMKLKFDKYWGQSNLVMSIGAVMDPRFKMKLPMFCFPTLYPLEGEADRHLAYLLNVLNELYQEYYLEDQAKSTDCFESCQVSSDDMNIDERDTPQGINEYENFLRGSGAVSEPAKSELDDYLAEKIVIPAPNSSKSFDVLAWWKGNSAKYPILSNMARDILGIPMSTVASESTFSAGKRVIEPHRSCLKPETVEMLMCGADWVRELYGLKKPIKDAPIVKDVIEIDLDFDKVT